MTEFTLKGRKVVGGYAEGEALVTKDAVAGWGGVDSYTGKIIDVRHELYDQSFAGKVLVYHGAKGSSGWAGSFQGTRLNGKAPAAMIFKETTTKIALGSVVTRCPAVTDLDQDPTEVIKTGDWVIVDGDKGTVTVRRG